MPEQATRPRGTIKTIQRVSALFFPALLVGCAPCKSPPEVPHKSEGDLLADPLLVLQRTRERYARLSEYRGVGEVSAPGSDEKRCETFTMELEVGVFLRYRFLDRCTGDSYEVKRNLAAPVARPNATRAESVVCKGLAPVTGAGCAELEQLVADIEQIAGVTSGTSRYEVGLLLALDAFGLRGPRSPKTMASMSIEKCGHESCYVLQLRLDPELKRTLTVDRDFVVRRLRDDFAGEYPHVTVVTFNPVRMREGVIPAAR